MCKIDSKLSRVSENLGVVFDKALSEPKFRWMIVNQPDEIMLKYGITDAKDILIYNQLVEKLKNFVVDRIHAITENEDIGQMCTIYKNEKSYRKANPNLNYEIALEYKNKK